MIQPTRRERNRWCIYWWFESPWARVPFSKPHAGTPTRHRGRQFPCISWRQRRFGKMVSKSPSWSGNYHCTPQQNIIGFSWASACLAKPDKSIQILFNSVNYGSQLFNVHSVLWTVLNPQVHLAFNGNCCFIWTISSTWVINLTNNTLKISENSNQSRKWKSITPFVCWLKNQTRQQLSYLFVWEKAPHNCDLKLLNLENQLQMFNAPWLCSHWGCVQHLQTLQL